MESDLMAKLSRSIKQTARRVRNDAGEIAASALVAGAKAGLTAAAVAVVMDLNRNVQRIALGSRWSRGAKIVGVVMVSAIAGLTVAQIRNRVR